MDDDYNYSMWVEVYNTTTVRRALSLYYFTDNLSNKAKWHPASGTVAANGYAILYFERDDRDGHANFKLDPEGGKLYLLNSSFTLLDSVVYPAQYRNISYGRKTDGGTEWAFFDEPSPAASNSGKVWSSPRCPDPVFSLKSGFYSTAQTVGFTMPATGDTIYYTTDGSEPTRQDTRYVDGTTITLTTGVTMIRAKTCSYGKLTSNVVTATYFINQRAFNNLPVVSVVTDPVNLTSAKIGIYCIGSNGITGNGQSSPCNFNQDWDRPSNYEFFDKTGTPQLNQELDIKILGGYTRALPLKSIGICPKKKFGDNQLRYDFFAATKPGHEYKDIQHRNSGNDFYNTMMRDGFIQSLVMHRMDLDYLAYEPCVIFMNGVYYGIENLRERSNSDYVWSNYGIDEEDITMLEATYLGVDNDKDIPTDAGFAELSTFLTDNDVSTDSVYSLVNGLIDVDEFINYLIPQIYIGNTDWPYNNVKMWKETTGGKWRWILFDTDFGFESGRVNHNTLTFALGENSDGVIGGYTYAPDWSTVIFRRLITNETFLNKFIDRFAIHISTTFETNRVNAIMDSIADRINEELVYHKAKWGGNSLESIISSQKVFSAGRPANMLNMLSNRFLNGVSIQTIHLSANIQGASYKLNSEPVIDAEATISYFKNRPVVLTANPVSGYTFSHWASATTQTNTLIPINSTWQYYYSGSIPASDWYTNSYTENGWSTGQAQLGYGDGTETTVLNYGTDANNKYTTAYFRKKITIEDLSSKTDFSISVTADDGAVVYVNGTEIGRANMPTGTVTYDTFSSSAIEATSTTFSVPETLLIEGTNVIAVEIHQYNLTSSDMIFDLQMMCSSTDLSSVISTDAAYACVLTENLDLTAVYEVSEEQVKENFIFINELVASNQTIMDEYAEMDDYIEIYNAGNEEVDLGGWYLTDTPDNKVLAQIPSTNASLTTVPAKDRIVLWADEDEEQGILHLGFKLSKDGETVVLSRVLENLTVEIVDSVTYPSMASNMSYSRTPDGSDVWTVQAPTWNSQNTPSFIPVVSGNAILIYPTLVTESFTVLNAKGCAISVFDLTGKIVFRSSCESDEAVIPASVLQRGMYLVTVDNQPFKIVKK